MRHEASHLADYRFIVSFTCVNAMHGKASQEVTIPPPHLPGL